VSRDPGRLTLQLVQIEVLEQLLYEFNFVDVFVHDNFLVNAHWVNLIRFEEFHQLVLGQAVVIGGIEVVKQAACLYLECAFADVRVLGLRDVLHLERQGVQGGDHGAEGDAVFALVGCRVPQPIQSILVLHQ